MACKDCTTTTNGVCKVCALLDGDLSNKKVGFCDFCGVWICEKCMPDIERRWVAFVKAKTGSLKEQWNKLLELWNPN